MNMSSKKTMLTAAVLLALSSSTAFAATPGASETKNLSHSSRAAADRGKNHEMEESVVKDRYEASISSQKKGVVSEKQVQQPASPGKVAPQPARLRWESVDTRIAARNEQPAFTLASQKAKPVIITAEDVKREEKLAVKEGRPAQELVGEVNMRREPPAQDPVRQIVRSQEQPLVRPTEPPVQPLVPAEKVPPKAVQTSAVQPVSASTEERGEQRPVRQRYPQMPHENFSLTPPADTAAPPKRPERFNALEENPSQRLAPSSFKDAAPVAEHSIRPDGVPDFSPNYTVQGSDNDLAGISDEVRRHILAGQLAMEVQLRRDPTVAGMRAITKVLRENTSLTRLQKIDFLIGFGRALHRSGLPRQQEALLIKTIAETY